jgi:hypothetical protein
VIFPVPVILKRFLALEFVLTFGIPVNIIRVKPLRRDAQASTYRASSGKSPNCFGVAKIRMRKENQEDKGKKFVKRVLDFEGFLVF